MPICTKSEITSAKFEKVVRELLDANPFVRHAVIGTSRLGKPIHALTLGCGEKSVLINAAHHANEWITTLILTRFIEELANNFDPHNPPPWAEKITLHCIPLVNPDGVDLVTGGLGKLRMAYKDALALYESAPAVLSFPSDWKANICGVDLNSNYPAGWELAREHKFSRGYMQAGARDYVGPAPLSEPESCAMAAYTVFHDIDVTVSLHTQGEEIYWQYPGFNPTGAEELARRFAAASGYKLEEVPPESSFAGYRDWFIETFNRPGFTIECGLGENPLPLSQFDEMYKKVSALLREVLV
ncbi:MAG: M14 family metallocarboxypeptidase [Defluviitaleaceae bacterium]|nr:M14 family metallocarboxypeptidase [Defluviitaleaceae bacterium]MCL2262103.1 M14 family metallocarboxypeptidase [Defluviitaleaceae bacterium]